MEFGAMQKTGRIDISKALQIIPSPLDWKVWQDHLLSHPNRAQADYVVQGIRDGFRVAHLCNEGLAPGTMKSYLAAVRHEQTSMGLGDTHIAQMPQLEYGLKGAKRRSVLGVRKRLPITQSILQKLREVWAKLAEQQDVMGGIMPLFLCLFTFWRDNNAV